MLQALHSHAFLPQIHDASCENDACAILQAMTQLMWHKQGIASHHTQGIQGQVLYLNLPQDASPTQQEVVPLSNRSSLETPLGGVAPIRPSQTNILVPVPACFFPPFFLFSPFLLLASVQAFALYAAPLPACLHFSRLQPSCLEVSMESIVWHVFAPDCKELLLLTLLPAYFILTARTTDAQTATNLQCSQFCAARLSSIKPLSLPLSCSLQCAQ